MHILFDVSRLIQRTGLSTPTGIDRVDFAYATHLVQKARHVSFVVGKSFPRIIPGREAGFLRRRDRPDDDGAGERVDPQADRLLALLARPARDWEASRGAQRLQAPAQTNFPFVARLAARLSQRGGAQSLPRQLKGVVYLHTSHSGLESPAAIDKLKKRGARIVVMVHDLIPIDYPEYCRPNDDVLHDSRMRSIQERADLVLVNSVYTKSRLESWAAERNLTLPPTKVTPLGVAPLYHDRATQGPAGLARDYFVTVGTIEPRKNHLLLLSLWRRLAQEMGENCPVLVVAGRRGWEMEQVADLLERCPALARCVIEIDGLGDAALAALMAGARGVLQPSHVEGFSLPVAEALALGAPLIASDIEAHREMVRDPDMLADPLDGMRWLALIKGLSGAGGTERRHAHAWSPLRQEDHVDAALREISQISSRKR
jgi:glycosyltransferase involved in cell wall biosynthesis